MYALSLSVGCAELIPGEEVLGRDVPAAFTLGGARSALGSRIAWNEQAWLATAPTAGETWTGGVAEATPALDVGWWGDRAVIRRENGEIAVDGEGMWTLEGSGPWAVGPAGVAVANGRGILLLDRSITVEIQGVAALAWGDERLLAMVCDPACEGRAWSLDGAPLGAFAAGGEDGAVGEWSGRAWAGDPRWDDPDAAGAVRAEDGTEIVGLAGDHLGGAIGGGHAVGTFNKWVVPARARIVPLDGGTVKAMEIGAENQPIVLDGDASTLMIGAPFYPAGGLPSGAVVVVP